MRRSNCSCGATPRRRRALRDDSFRGLMLVQVVHCHPLADSYNHALFRAIVDTLEGNGHDVVATELYREGFDPAMTPDERRSYFAPPYDDTAVAGYIDVLRRAEGLIFCFPQWWF